MAGKYFLQIIYEQLFTNNKNDAIIILAGDEPVPDFKMLPVSNTGKKKLPLIAWKKSSYHIISKHFAKKRIL